MKLGPLVVRHRQLANVLVCISASYLWLHHSNKNRPNLSEKRRIENKIKIEMMDIRGKKEEGLKEAMCKF